MRSPRRFPPPWSVEDIGAAFVVAILKWAAAALMPEED